MSTFVARYSKDARMEPQRPKNHIIDSGALHFELLCDKEEIYPVLLYLREKAQDRCSRVSPIFRLYNEECLVENPEDPLANMKLTAQGILLHNKKVLLVNPESIISFAVELHNGSIVYFGFASYPETVSINGIKITVPNSDNASWSGLVYTKDNDLEEYKELLELLNILKKKGVRVEMNERLSNIRRA